MIWRVLPLFFALSAAAWAGEAAPLSFSQHIRPILSENCFYCHGQDPNHRKANLRIDVLESTLKPAESGDIAIVPGKPADSALVQRILSTDSDEQMPPPDSHRTLSPEQKATLQRWIAEGAAYEPHWAYVAPERPALPEVQRVDWPRNGIDRFLLARLERDGLSPSPEAGPVTLIRRVTLDLTGLPPSPEEVDAFLADAAPGAYERLVDRLLASPHYGERMALPWLDSARYADSNGFQQDGDTFQWMWRDWVVKSLNEGKPFDQFSIEQLAGDLLPSPTTDQMVATAFNRNHMLNGEGGAVPEEQRYNILFDRVDTTATTWLGLTVACAQCHDHKYDPITQRDYYSLLSLFNQVGEDGLVVPGGPSRIRVSQPVFEVHTEESRKRLAELQAAADEAEQAAQGKAKFDIALAAWVFGLSPESKAPDGSNLDGRLTAIIRTEPAKRTDEQNKELEWRSRSQFEYHVWQKMALKDEGLKKWEAAKAEVTKYSNESVPHVMVMKDDRPRETHLLERGDYLKPKEQVETATPAFLPPLAPNALKNRLGFARWLFAPENPLTARVQANRMWQLFFGTGLVKSSEDLGVQSEAPVHRELLDWLAVEFRESGWNVKHMHRLIVTSAAYRQSSKVTPELLQRDPENRLISRGARFREPSLILRDIALSASGLLDGRIGGAPVYPYQPEGIWETLAITHERDFTYPASQGADLYRRSIYTFWRRTIGPANMFDASNRQTCKVRTAVTSTPLHALTTLNDPTWVEAARVLAAHSYASAAETEARLTYSFRRVLARTPTAADLTALGRAYSKQLALYEADPKAAELARSTGASPIPHEIPAAEHAALTAVCLVLFNLDEALTRE